MSKFFITQFEGTDDAITEEIVMKLEETVKGYGHITGRNGWLVCALDKPNDTFITDITEVVHAHNDGLWCTVREVSYATIEQYL